ELDVGLDLFAPQLVWDRNDRGLDHLGMRPQDTLDLGGRNVFAGATDDLLLSPDEVEQPAFVAAGNVAGMVPAAAVGFSGDFRPVQVAGVKVRSADQAFAGLAQGHVDVIVVDQPDSDAG